MRRHLILLTGVLLTTVACASSGTAAAEAGTDGPAPAGASRGSNRNVLTAQELATVGSQDLYDVVNALRPRWLQNTLAGRSAANAVTVFVNGQLAGNLDALRQLQKSAVQRINYYSLSEAQGRFGTRVNTPVIDVRVGGSGQ